MRVDIDPVRYRPSGQPGKSPRWRDVLSEIGLTYSELAFRWGTIVFVVALLYLVYGLYTLYNTGFGGLSAEDAARFVRNFNLGVAAFKWSGAALIAACVIRYYNEQGTGQLLTLLGAAAYWGTPLAIGFILPRTGPEISHSIVSGLQWLGKLCLVPGISLLLYELVLGIKEAWEGRRRVKAVKIPKEDALDRKGEALGPALVCWNTCFCQPYVRDLCPRYVEKTPCWRRKEGCFCEDKIVFRALELKSDKSDFFRKMRHLLGTPADKGILLTPALKRARCRKCPIYAEHQRMKYRLVVPLAFPAAGVIGWFLAGRLQGAIAGGLGRIDQVVREYSFSRTQAETRMGELQHLMGDPMTGDIVFYTLVALLGLFVLTMSLRLLEWLIFEIQI